MMAGVSVCVCVYVCVGGGRYSCSSRMSTLAKDELVVSGTVLSTPSHMATQATIGSHRATSV